MVFVKTSPVYEQSLNRFYIDDPALSEKSYAEQHATIISGCFGWANGWGKYLGLIEGYSVHDLIVNAEILQKKWAQENGYRYGEQTWCLDILTAQLAELKAEIWFSTDFSITPLIRSKIRSEIPSIKLIIGWDGIALNSQEHFFGCDIMMSCADFVTDYYSEHGYNAYTFNHCFDPEILKSLRYRDPLYEISFIGSIFLRDGGHSSRLKIIGELARHLDIDFWVTGLIPSDGRLFIKQQIRRVLHGRFDEFSKIRMIAKRNREPVFGDVMLQVLADSHLTLNTHIDSAGNKAGNMRLFEATGVGTCLVTDWKENIGEFFVPDEEVICFKSVDECVDKVKMLLKDNALRSQISKAGQKRTLESHTFEKRIKDFTDYLARVGF